MTTKTKQIKVSFQCKDCDNMGWWSEIWNPEDIFDKEMISTCPNCSQKVEAYRIGEFDEPS